MSVLLCMQLVRIHQRKPIAGKISHPLQTNVCDPVSPLKLGVSLVLDASKDGTDLHDRSARIIRSQGIVFFARPFQTRRKR